MSSMSASVPFCIAMIRLALAEDAVDHPHVGDDAAVLVELGVEDQRPRRRRRLALRRRDPLDDRLEHVDHPLSGLGRDPHHLVRVASEQVGDLAGHALGLGAGQVDLVEHRDQLEAVLDRQIGVGDGLRLDTLSGVDDQQRPLAGGEAARHLVGEVDVPGRVDQVQVVGLAVGGPVVDPHGLGLDRDPALALEVHRVEDLGAHLLRVDGAGDLEDAIGERRLAVVDVGDDREVADVLHGLGRAARGSSRPLSSKTTVGARADDLGPRASPAVHAASRGTGARPAERGPGSRPRNRSRPRSPPGASCGNPAGGRSRRSGRSMPTNRTRWRGRCRRTGTGAMPSSRSARPSSAPRRKPRPGPGRRRSGSA